jgi:hypothetical protein
MSLFFKDNASFILTPVAYKNLNSTGMEKRMVFILLLFARSWSAALKRAITSFFEKMYGVNVERKTGICGM